jgi:hypothetical protein
VARTALGAEDAREQMENRNTSFLLKMVYYYEMSQGVEMVSNIQPNFFALNVRRYSPQPSIFVRSFSAITSPHEVFLSESAISSGRACNTLS